MYIDGFAQLSGQTGHSDIGGRFDFGPMRHDMAKGGFGKIYKANWIDGNIYEWNNKNKNWKREHSNGFVALKSLNNSKNVRLEFINEVFKDIFYLLYLLLNIFYLFFLFVDYTT